MIEQTRRDTAGTRSEFSGGGTRCLRYRPIQANAPKQELATLKCVSILEKVELEFPRFDAPFSSACSVPQFCAAVDCPRGDRHHHN